MSKSNGMSKSNKTDIASVIEIYGVGGIIVQRTIPIPAGGGITVLKGACGTGKTTSLNAVKTLLGQRDPSLTANDGLGAGYIRGFGAEVKIGKQVRRSGTPVNELEVQHIEDRLDMSKIVDPGIKDPEANDAVRLRAIVQNSGVQIDRQEFVRLVDELELPPGLLEGRPGFDLSGVTGDPVEMAAKFRRAVQAAALALEKEAQPIQERAAACQLACDGVDLSAPCDHEQLSAAYSEAVARLAKISEQRAAAEKMAAAVKRAQQWIDEQNASYQGLPIELASKEVASKLREVELSRELVEAAEKRLAKAIVERDLAEKERDLALAHEDNLRAMRGVLDEADRAGECPSDAEVSQAVMSAEAAEAGLMGGERVRRAREKHEEMLSLSARSNLLSQAAGKLRRTAALADDVLSRAIAVPGVSWYGGRLLYDKKRDGNKELFERLSTGEKWRVAVDTAVIGLGELTGDGTRLSLLHQEAWQALDTEMRDAVNQMILDASLNVLTAEVSPGPLTAEIYVPTGSSAGHGSG